MRRSLSSKRRHSNPEAEQIEHATQNISRKWHGRDPIEVVEVEREITVPTTLAMLGDLLAFDLLDIEGRKLEEEWNIEDLGLKIASTDWEQVQIIGDASAIEEDLPALLEELGFPDARHQAKKGHVLIGQAQTISYRTDKHHLQDSHGEIAEYIHEFGEEGGDLPTLTYDRGTRALVLVGGSYKITTNGIVN